MTSTTHHSPLTTHISDSRLRRLEIALVLAITVAGLLVRIAFPSRAAVEHFDEGVYATRLWFAEGDDAPYPDRHLYAPPLVPWMARWSIDLFGPGLWGAMLPGIVFGTLTIPLVWWTARRWFGPAAGLAAAILAAGSDFHVLYSRTALTDVPLCFWLLAAVYCAWESFRAGSFRWAVAAGVAAGLAWWTKYNGWLALVITAAGGTMWLVSRWIGWRRGAAGWSSTPSVPSPPRQPDGLEIRPTDHASGAASPFIARTIACWIVLAAVACAVWSPVFLGAREYGGYGAILANHRRYVVGLSGWLDSFLQQVANHRLLDGPLSWAAVAVACAVPIVSRLAARSGLTVAGCVGTLSLAGLAAGVAAGRCSTLVLALLAAGGVLDQLLPGRSRRLTCAADGDRWLAAWLTAAWFAGLLMATPLYRAYPRLTLPWLVVAWLAASAAVERLAAGTWWDRTARPAARQFRAGAAVLLTVAVGAPVILGNWERAAAGTIVGWQKRTALATLADSIVGLAKRVVVERGGDPQANVPFVVYVYAEPAIVFHLTERGYVAQPASNLDFVHTAAERPDIPTFFVAGPHARRTPEFERQWNAYESRFELYFDARYTPSALVLLNLRSSLEPEISAHPEWPDSDVLARYGSVTEPVRIYLVR